ncbi:hypothetical protein [Enterobacter quasiroggenkampii]|uniref:hypothetical protein n=1 Tax=Enterobacter quasiroggenkampii TaxID=2497436 RepID=UPI002074E19F|nr:hypothetical protein [Enterobacter quasiroggenkampii]MCM7169123.1 hypothetical protein [Enterobacter quasiroggenkampii]
MDRDFEIDKNEVVVDFSFSRMGSVYLLPLNYSTPNEITSYPSSSLSFIKILKAKTPAGFINEPKSLVELRSADWFGPILLITAQVYTQNPDIFQIIIDSVRETLGGVLDERNKEKVNIEIVCEKTSDSKMISVKYSGGDSGLDKLLDTVKDVMDND